eukprot:5880918-Pyramimonas_sp.AAC.1
MVWASWTVWPVLLLRLSPRRRCSSTPVDLAISAAVSCDPTRSAAWPSALAIGPHVPEDISMASPSCLARPSYPPAA